MALLGRPIELASDVLVALNNHKGALRVADDDVAIGHFAGSFPLWELEVPFRADADDGGEEGKEEDGEEGHAVVVVDGQRDENDGHGAAQDGEPSQRSTR